MQLFVRDPQHIYDSAEDQPYPFLVLGWTFVRGLHRLGLDPQHIENQLH